MEKPTTSDFTETQNDNSQIEKLVEMGKLLVTSGKFDEALTFYDKALAIDPTNVNVIIGKGNVFLYASRFSEASAWFDMALQINPNNVDAWLGKGSALTNSGNYSDAIMCYDQALAIKPDSADALYHKGLNLTSLGRYEEAIQLFDKILAINPQDQSVLNSRNVAMSYLNLQKSTSWDGTNFSTLDTVRPSIHATDDKWVLEDTLGYKPYAVGIYTFLTHPQTKPPLTIGIQAPWGGGKTSIMRMVQKELDPHGPGLIEEKKEKPQKTKVKECSLDPESKKKFKISGQKPKMLTIWFNAWKYQNSEQIWAGLADAIITQFTQRLEPDDQKRFLLELNLRRGGKDQFQQKINKHINNLWWNKVRKHLWKYLTGIGSSAIWFTVEQTGVIQSIGTVFGQIPLLASTLGVASLIMFQRNEAAVSVDDQDADEVLGDLVQVPNYRTNVGFIHHVYADMQQVLGIMEEYDKDMKLAIFIDDLDRCSPSNVADVFEGLNMFISAEFKNCFFIIGMDVEIVTAALEKAHSQIIEKMPSYARRSAVGWRFMDKFVQMPIIIPPPEPRYIHVYTAALFQTKSDNLQGKIDVKQLITNLSPNVDDVQWETFLLSATTQDPRFYTPQEQEILHNEFEITKNVIKTNELVKNIEKAKDEYSDQNPEVRNQVAKAVIDFSNNPREMKRFMNVLRFNYFLRDGRIRSNLPAPSPDQLRRWIVLTMKWPQVVLWLNRSSSGVSFDKPADNQTQLKLRILEEWSTRTMSEWQGKLGELLRISPGDESVNWINDEELKKFFEDKKGILSDAVNTGLY